VGARNAWGFGETPLLRLRAWSFQSIGNGEMIWVFEYDMTKEQGNNTMNHLVGGFNPA
jgi:hypothetical protein